MNGKENFSEASRAGPLRVGLLGCGRIAEHHLRFIAATPGAQLVAVADVDAAAAKRVGDARGVPSYTSLSAMLDAARLDVLHVLTPPAFHAAAAREALQRRVHVLVEKPVALDAKEADELYRLADANGVTLCPDFILLFHPRMRKAEVLIESGALGKVVSCECHYSLDDPLHEAREAARLPWSFGLPGGPFHDVLTHPIYLVMRWIGAPRRIVALPHSHGSLPQDLTDHLEIAIDGERGTGHITLSTVARPYQRYVRVRCERGSVTVDFHTMSVFVERNGRIASLDRLVSNLRLARQLTTSVAGNVVDRLTGRLVPYQGLGPLMAAYYDSIRARGAPPISREVAVGVTRVEDEVVAQGGRLRLDLSRRAPTQRSTAGKERVLVTGASGYIGRALVRRLVAAGHPVRAFVRPTSRIRPLEDAGVEIVFGDVRSLDDLRAASKDIDAIVHLAAGLGGSEAFVRSSCAEGTRNLAAAARETGVGKVIYVGSTGIYDFASLKNGALLDEDSPLETRPEDRGVATLGKLEAERVALAQLGAPGPRWTIVRPSLVFGGGRPMAPLFGRRVGGMLLAPSDGRRPASMVHVDDVTAAIEHLLVSPDTSSEVVNVSHVETPTLREVAKAWREAEPGAPRVVFLPRFASAALLLAVGLVGRLRGRKARVHLRQLAGGYRRYAVSPRRATLRGWRPSAPLLDQVRRRS